MLTVKELLRAPKKNYMNKEQLDFFKQHLLILKEKTQAHIDQLRQELAEEKVEADTLDQAALEDECHIKLRIIERESKLLPKIDTSLQRIENGTYGYCEETGNPIGIQRLLARPTATLSTEAKEAQETKEKHYSD
ncbi:MAG: RNA polymerase-binding protein DksA [Gammaproteobacteria bacterium]|nr:RNA polymerase-binding protein DksA [Gammaproteobacteria bacterium]